MVRVHAIAPGIVSEVPVVAVVRAGGAGIREGDIVGGVRPGEVGVALAIGGHPGDLYDLAQGIHADKSGVPDGEADGVVAGQRVSMNGVRLGGEVAVSEVPVVVAGTTGAPIAEGNGEPAGRRVEVCAEVAGVGVADRDWDADGIVAGEVCAGRQQAYGVGSGLAVGVGGIGLGRGAAVAEVPEVVDRAPQGLVVEENGIANLLGAEASGNVASAAGSDDERIAESRTAGIGGEDGQTGDVGARLAVNMESVLLIGGVAVAEVPTVGHDRGGGGALVEEVKGTRRGGIGGGGELGLTGRLAGDHDRLAHDVAELVVAVVDAQAHVVSAGATVGVDRICEGGTAAIAEDPAGGSVAAGRGIGEGNGVPGNGVGKAGGTAVARVVDDDRIAEGRGAGIGREDGEAGDVSSRLGVGVVGLGLGAVVAVAKVPVVSDDGGGGGALVEEVKGTGTGGVGSGGKLGLAGRRGRSANDVDRIAVGAHAGIDRGDGQADCVGASGGVGFCGILGEGKCPVAEVPVPRIDVGAGGRNVGEGDGGTIDGVIEIGLADTAACSRIDGVTDRTGAVAGRGDGQAYLADPRGGVGVGRIGQIGKCPVSEIPEVASDRVGGGRGTGKLVASRAHWSSGKLCLAGIAAADLNEDRIAINAKTGIDGFNE